MIHLTNDAVQKHAEDYGKYEAGNKLSYTDFQNYLDKNFADLNICFDRDLLPQMKVSASIVSQICSDWSQIPSGPYMVR